MSSTNFGRFVWYDLLTAEPREAISFYGDVLGWTTRPWERDYTLFVGSDGPLAGAMKLPVKAPKTGPKAMWKGNILVENVDATVNQARNLGGAIHVDPWDIPKVGRIAVIADPQGASLNVLQPLMHMKPHDPDKTGAVTWHELLTTDRDAAFRFYSTLFGWKKMREHDLGAVGTYLIYGVDGVELGGIFNKTKDMPLPPMFWYYVRVADLDSAIARAKSKGGRLMNGPMEVPGGARIAQLADPQGGMFALHEAKK